MSASVWAYPWDLLDEGIENAAERIAGLGLDGIRMACAYHSGKFISPRSAGRRVVFPEGGVVYFRPREECFRGLAIQPVVSELLDAGDPLEELIRVCHSRGMKTTSWLVCAHNTRLAQRYPEYAVRNAFGDAYKYCLCPSQAATRDYLLALVRELVDSYEVDAVELESPGYLGFLHGYHHEFYGVNAGLLEQCLLSLCFCPACEGLLRKAGVDPAPLRERVRHAIDTGLAAEGVSSEPLEAQAEQIGEFFRADAELWALVEKRCEVVTALVRDIAETVHWKDRELYCFGPVFVRPPSLGWVEGTEARRIAELVDCWEIALYYDSQEQRVSEARRAAALRLPCALGAGINAGCGCTRDAADLAAAAEAAKHAGIPNIAFYNYGTLPEHRLEWIREAVRVFRS